MNQNADLIAAAIQMAHFNFYTQSNIPLSATGENYEIALRQKIIENYYWLKLMTEEAHIGEVNAKFSDKD